MTIRIRLAETRDVQALGELIEASVRGLLRGAVGERATDGLWGRHAIDFGWDLFCGGGDGGVRRGIFGSAVAGGLRRVEQAEDFVWGRSLEENREGTGEGTGDGARGFGA